MCFVGFGTVTERLIQIYNGRFLGLATWRWSVSLSYSWISICLSCYLLANHEVAKMGVSGVVVCISKRYQWLSAGVQ